MIREYIGDVLNTNADIIAHQTNCIGVMGAGVAKQIKTRLSIEEYNKYVVACKNSGKKLLGHVQLLSLMDGKLVANVFGENIPSGRGLDTDYEALECGLRTLYKFAKKEHLSVAIPGLMGCGLAGGDWNIVRSMIENIFGNSEVPLEIVFFLEEDYTKWHQEGNQYVR